MFSCSPCPGQTPPVAEGTRLPTALKNLVKDVRSHTIASSFPEEARTVTVYLPPGYERDVDTRYPTMYILDGQRNALLFAPIARFFAARDRAPNVILVSLSSAGGIRGRDYTPANPSDDGSTIVGANQYLQHLEQELIPFIDATYRTEPFRILSGESRGGLFAMHAMIERPELFQAYFLLSPALYHDEAAIIPRLRQFLDRESQLNISLYMNMGSEGSYFADAFNAASAAFEENTPAGLAWHIDLLPDEPHGLTGISGQYNAFRRLFSDWRIPFELVESDGAAGAIAHFENLSNQYGYSVRPPENSLTEYGYTFFGLKKYDIALGLFRLCRDLYPRSANAYDSVADGLEAIGQREEAIGMMQKAIEIAGQTNDPNLKIFKDHLQRLEREGRPPN
ncbi:MAG: alpha/beta hydrolase-fold protein, partial [Planctomycetota bacterium]|nr:alpha/beta hydrolase-fold protein [Planctomycetota bacterium]